MAFENGLAAARPLRGVHVDHERRSPAGWARIEFVIDFDPLPSGEDERLHLRMGADSAGGHPLADRLATALKQEMYDIWWNEVLPCPVHAVLRHCAWEEEGADRAFLGTLTDIAARLAVEEAVRALREERPPRPVGRRRVAPPPPLPRAVHGVHVRHVIQTACPAEVALAWADMLPLAAGADSEYQFVVDLPEGRRSRGGPLPAEFAEAFGAGVFEAWERVGAGRPPYAARVVLRDAAWHEYDSHTRSFHRAGAMAGMETLRCIEEGREPRPVGRGARRRLSGGDSGSGTSPR
ncbi:hypothetical protein GCM10027294_22500 [Marinactinospora endophytica]